MRTYRLCKIDRKKKNQIAINVVLLITFKNLKI